MEIRTNVALAPLTTLQVGGAAQYFVRAETEEDIVAGYQAAIEKTGKPPVIIGGGSNVLIADGAHDALFLQPAIGGIAVTETAEGTMLNVGAGEDWDELVAFATERGLGGLENLSGIPGYVGAAPIQNINAYGVTVAETIIGVRVYDPANQEFRDLDREACDFGYRSSYFKTPAGQSLIVVGVTFLLSDTATQSLTYQSASQSIAKILAEKGVAPSPASIRGAVLEARGNIGMLIGHYNSAGSFFMNTIVSAPEFASIKEVVERDFKDKDKRFSPWYWELPDGRVKISTAFLLECSPYNKSTYGEKRINGVGLSPKHSLSIVTEAGATAAAVKEFYELIRTSVKNIFGVTINREVVFID